MKFKAEFKREYWQCGDGCCSDSWVNLDLSNDEGYFNSWEELRQIDDKEDAEEYARDLIEGIFDLEKGKYELELDVNIEY